MSSIAVTSRLTLLPYVSLAISDGAVVSAATPTRAFTLIANRQVGFGPGAEYKLSERTFLHFRYDYNRYDDDVTAGLAGRYQGYSFGLSRVF